MRCLLLVDGDNRRIGRRLRGEADDRAGRQREGTAGRHLAVTVTDKNGQPVQGLTLVAHLVRPVSTALDQRLTLRSEGAGIYGADVVLPANGNWELRLSSVDGAADWQTVQRIFVK